MFSWIVRNTFLDCPVEDDMQLPAPVCEQSQSVPAKFPSESAAFAELATVKESVTKEDKSDTTEVPVEEVVTDDELPCDGLPFTELHPKCPQIPCGPQFLVVNLAFSQCTQRSDLFHDFLERCTDKNRCREVQAWLQNYTPDGFFQLLLLFQVLLSDVFRLACHPEANYVMTVFISCAPVEMSRLFIPILLQDAQALSCDQSGYRVASMLFQIFGQTLMQDFFDKLDLRELICHRHGNFVANAVFEFGSLEQKRRLVDTIICYVDETWLVGYCSHVVAAAVDYDQVGVVSALGGRIRRDEKFLPKFVRKSDAVSLLEKLASISNAHGDEFQTWLQSEMSKYQNEINHTKDRKAKREAGKEKNRQKRNAIAHGASH